MRLVIFILYNTIIYPSFFIIISILALFNRKIRNGFIGRLHSRSILIDYFKKNNINTKIYWFHCSSYGEYLQVEPIIEGIKKNNINCMILLSFFSPSGFNNAHNEHVDCKVYLPFDFYWTINSILNLVKPHKVIFATSDLWYNFIWVANHKNIETILVGAKSKNNFVKTLSVFNGIYKPIYQSITKIFTITNSDTVMIKDYVGLSNKDKVYQMGNPRFDQVISDAKQISGIDKKPILQRQNILLFGSMHHEDRNIVLSHTVEYLEKNENLEIIWASHEPDEQDNRYLESMFSRRGVSVGRVSSIEDIKTSEERVKIINVVGILAKLYWRVRIAYIGGGFSTGVHNLMEPSVAEVPTIFGPNYKEFDEAVEIINNKSGFCIKNGREFIESLDSLLSDEKQLLLASTSAKELITKNSGASSKIVEEILAN